VALKVGELVAALDVDDDGFVRGMRKAETEFKASGRRIETQAGATADGVGREFSKGGDKAGRSFGSTLKHWFTGSGSKDMQTSGSFGASVFGSGFLGALKTPVLGPAIAAILLAAVATALPAVGAVAAGGLVTGFGAGLAGLGIVFAAKSEAVKKVWSDTLTAMGADMQLLARPFESTLIVIAGIFRRTFDAFNPYLARAFAKMAGPIQNFVDSAARALEGLIPAIDPITDAFNRVLASLGPALQSAVSDLSDGLIALAKSVEENPQALADVVEGVGGLSREALGLITTLNDVNGQFSDLTGGLSLVEITIGAVSGPIIALKAVFDGLSFTLGLVNAAFSHSRTDVDANAHSMLTAADAVSAAAKAHGDLGLQAQHAGPPIKSAAEKIQAAKDAAAAAKVNFEALITSMFRLQNLALGLSGAQINLQSAFDDASQAIKDNGTTLNINTEKGRANKTALNNVAKAANDQTEAIIRAGKGYVAAATSAESSRRNFVKIAIQMGMSKTAAQKLAAQLIAIPNVVRTAKLQADKTQLEYRIRQAKQALDSPKLTATKKAKLTAYIGELQRQVNAAQAKINSLRGKTVVIRYTATGVNLTAPSSVGRRQHGGPVAAAGAYLVGERGPEMFVPKTAGVVVPNTRLNTAPRAWGGGSGSGDIRVVLELRSSGSRWDDLLVQQIAGAVRVRGGNAKILGIKS
jgi:hypothetical protein